MDKRPVEDWQRLGRLLKQRRPQLAPSYRIRRTFADENHLTDKTVQEIENAYRQSFTPEMLSSIEIAYRLPAGTIERVVRDREITTLPSPTATTPQPQALNQRRAEDESGIELPFDLDLASLAPWERHIWLTPEISVDDRRVLILFERLRRNELEHPELILALYRMLGELLPRHLLGRDGNPGRCQSV